MKQILIKKGVPVVAELPEPEALPGWLLVRLVASCVSPGTEMAGIASSGKSLLQRVIEKPDKAKAALLQMKDRGVGAVWKQAKQQLEREGLCGYSAAGIVIETGSECIGFRVGMRVAVAGAGLANHAEVVAVPVNLVIPIPDALSDEDASSVALGGIAMQAVRRADVSLGEMVAVIGCGPLGLLAIQMLHASGCRVFATDLDARRLEMAKALGAEVAISPSDEDIVKKATHWSNGQGVDAAIVFTATSSSEPLSQAFRMSRRKGRVVLAGVAGGEYKREDMYAKELDFLISTSYGPGRYDENYELRGVDYPYAYVRWTEKRNMEAYLALLASGRVKVGSLIEVTETIENAPAAYERLKAPDRPLLAVLKFETHSPTSPPATITTPTEGVWKPKKSGTPVSIALVGAGSFISAMHVPILAAMPGRVRVPWAVSRTGTSARSCAQLLPDCRPETDLEKVLGDPDVDAILIGSRHDTHAELAIRALRAGKGVFVEKPMCLTLDEFHHLKEVVKTTEAPFMVGYNRRFSPFSEKIRAAVASRTHPLMLQYTMNAGYLPSTHWTQGPEGGGRLMGEACHIIDLFRSLVGHPVASLHCAPLRGRNPAALPTDNFSLILEYTDGSVATLLYTALGHQDLPKERMEIYFDEKILKLDDYRSMTAHGLAGADLSLKNQDKGHTSELDAFYQALAGGPRFPIPWDELAETWIVSHEANRVCLGK